MQGIEIDQVTFHGAGQVQVDTGLLGWASFTLNGAVRLEGIAVRRTLLGHYALSFPAREAPGRKRFWVRPVSDEARIDIEAQVLGTLGLAEEVRR